MARDRVAEWSEALARDGRVEIAQPTVRIVLLLLVSAFFVAVGVAMVATGGGVGARVGGALVTVLFGIGLYVFPRRLLRGGPALVVDEHGLTMPPYDATMPWSAAYGTQLFQARGTSLVQVATDPRWLDEFYASHRVMGLVRGVNRRLTGGVECLSLPSPLKADTFQLTLWLGEEISRRRPAQP